MFFCYEDYQISKPILMLEALTLPRETKVSEACHMFVSTERYPLNFIFRFPPFKDFM